MKPLAEDVLGGLSRQEFYHAQNACKCWRIGIVVKPLCGYPGIILEFLACYFLYRARRVFRTPALLWLLIAIWPVWSLVQALPSFMPMLSMGLGPPDIGLMFALNTLIYLTQVIGGFFVRAGIFRQWCGFYSDPDLEHCIRWWERAFLFIQLPLASVYLSVFTLWLVEGWRIEDFKDLDPARIAISDYGVLGVLFFMSIAGWLLGLIYEYKVVVRFEKRLFGAWRERREREEEAAAASESPSVAAGA